MKEQIKLLIVSLILGFCIGLISAGFLLAVKVTTSFTWKYLPYAPLLGILGGFVVGLIITMFGTHDGIGFEGIAADLKKTGVVKFLVLPQIVLNAFVGLVTGASIGPEAPLMGLGGYIGSFLSQKLKMKEDQIKAITALSLGTSLGTLLESPVAGAIFFIENPSKKLQEDKRALYSFIFSSFIAACIGFGIFMLFLGPYIANMHLIPPYTQFAFIDIFYCLVLGVVGAIWGVMVSRTVERSQQFGSRFARWSIPRAVAAGFLVGCVGYFFPLVLFSGQNQLPVIINDLSQYSLQLLLILIALKIIVTSLSFGGGYQGGNIFPTLFISALTGVCVHYIFPFIPLPIAMSGIMGGMIFTSFKLPLFSIFLLIVMSEPNLIPFITLSVAGGMFVLLSIESRTKTEKATANVLKDAKTTVSRTRKKKR